VCGRYTLGTPLEGLLDAFDLRGIEFDFAPRWNVAPTQSAPVVVNDGEGGRKMGPLRWGLVPFWAKDPGIGNRMINARSETVAEKPAYRAAFRKRRCLVPADGFYEWEKRDGGNVKVPHWTHYPDRRPFGMAGLWESWRPDEGEPLFTFTILTTDASDDLRYIHPRMPVILPPDAWDLWLDPEAQPEELLDLLGPRPAGEMAEYEVSTRVNSPRNDDADLVEPVEG
jgi:putative SOS response-associated peptidase YedK